MPDLRLELGFADHRKTKKLVLRCGEEAVRCLLRLWEYAARKRVKGTLFGMSKEDIEIEAAWTGESGLLVDAMVEIGWINVDENGVFALHDWKQHQPWVYASEERSKNARRAAIAKWEKRGIKPKDAPRIRNACGTSAPSMRNDENRNAPSPTPTPTPIPTPTPTPTPNGEEEEARGVSEADQRQLYEHIKYRMIDWQHCLGQSGKAGIDWCRRLCGRFGIDHVLLTLDKLEKYYATAQAVVPKQQDRARQKVWEWCERELEIIAKQRETEARADREFPVPGIG